MPSAVSTKDGEGGAERRERLYSLTVFLRYSLKQLHLQLCVEVYVYVCVCECPPPCNCCNLVSRVPTLRILLTNTKVPRSTKVLVSGVKDKINKVLKTPRQSPCDSHPCTAISIITRGSVCLSVKECVCVCVGGCDTPGAPECFHESSRRSPPSPVALVTAAGSLQVRFTPVMTDQINK